MKEEESTTQFIEAFLGSLRDRTSRLDRSVHDGDDLAQFTAFLASARVDRENKLRRRPDLC